MTFAQRFEVDASVVQLQTLNVVETTGQVVQMVEVRIGHTKLDQVHIVLHQIIDVRHQIACVGASTLQVHLGLATAAAAPSDRIVAEHEALTIADEVERAKQTTTCDGIARPTIAE